MQDSKKAVPTLEKKSLFESVQEGNKKEIGEWEKRAARGEVMRIM